MMWLDQLRAVVRRDFLSDLRYPVAFAFGLFDALLLLISYAFLAGVFGDRRPDGYAPLAFLLVGVALTDCLTTALVCLAHGVRNSQQAGTMKALLALPIVPARLMGLSLAYPLLRAALDFVIFMSAAFALGVSFTGMHITAVVATFLLGVSSVCVIGLVSAAFAIAFKRGDPVLWAVGTATWLLSGVLYPTSVLPAWLGVVSALLPTTHALNAMRAAVLDGATWSALAPDLFALLGFDLVGLPLALWALTAAVTYARRTGTLGHS